MLCTKYLNEWATVKHVLDKWISMKLKFKTSFGGNILYFAEYDSITAVLWTKFLNDWETEKHVDTYDSMKLKFMIEFWRNILYWNNP